MVSGLLKDLLLFGEEKFRVFLKCVSVCPYVSVVCLGACAHVCACVDLHAFSVAAHTVCSKLFMYS